MNSNEFKSVRKGWKKLNLHFTSSWANIKFIKKKNKCENTYNVILFSPFFISICNFLSRSPASILAIFFAFFQDIIY